LFGGVGIAQIIFAFYVGIYYNVIVSYSIFFLFSSFDSSVPWSSCDNWWNTEFCRIGSATDSRDMMSGFVSGCVFSTKTLLETFKHETYRIYQYLPQSTSDRWILTEQQLESIPDSIRSELPCRTGSRTTPAEEYMQNYVLRLSSQFQFVDSPINWNNTLIFGLSWLLIFFVLMKGIKEAGKIIWFTALFPYLVLTIFLIRGATLGTVH